MADSTSDPILLITPSGTLEFPVVLSQSITINLRLENTTAGNVAFKIKTTAPKNYLVRPSTGVISGKRHQDVQIILQPLHTEPPEDSGDRFLVQATRTEETATPTREFWGTVNKNDLFDQKLHVKFKKHGSESTVRPTADTLSALKAAKLPADPAELQTRYEDLLRFAAELQEEKSQMQNDLENLRQRLMHAMQETARNARIDGNERAKSAMFPFGFELWHAIPTVLVALIVLKLLGYL